MSDSERRDRDRRRVGDATRQRIEDLADGWDVPKPPASPKKAQPKAVAEEASDTERVPKSESPEGKPPPLPKTKLPKPKGTLPKPRPELPLPTRTPPRAKPPPPPNPTRKASPSSPPPVPASRAAAAVHIDSEAEAEEPTQLTPPTAGEVGDDDPTLATPSPARGTGGHAALRKPVVLPRKRGLLGDIAYVRTAVFALSRSRRELAELRRKLAVERERRAERVLVLAREAVGDPDLDLGAIREAREHMAEIEEERSKAAGAAAGAEAEIDSLTLARAKKGEAAVAELRRLEAELAAIEDKLGPLERDAVQVRKRAADLDSMLKTIDKKIATTRSRTTSAKGTVPDPAALEAELASLRAEREDIARDEPELAAQLDELDPKIASLGAARTETRKAIEEVREREKEASERLEDEIAAVRARRQVDLRGVADADKKREAALEELGERLTVERPDALSRRLAAIDEHDVSIATLERHVVELEELVSGLDRAKLTRGIAAIVGILAVLGLLVWLVVA